MSEYTSSNALRLVPSIQTESNVVPDSLASQISPLRAAEPDLPPFAYRRFPSSHPAWQGRWSHEPRENSDDSRPLTSFASSSLVASQILSAEAEARYARQIEVGVAAQHAIELARKNPEVARLHEEELITLWEQGEEAFQIILRANFVLVIRTVLEFLPYTQANRRGELLAAGGEMLRQMLMKYDYLADGPFAKFARSQVRQAIWQAICRP
ncbi:hypothetical protein BK816_06490 [Boudabousia tangfeifanii]|uniref:Uncharacterized protein n=1 Tax=Boudabousia tangfeifanii TaxID=1912795 RepID=A0A1D9MLE6_9ACTO|nr:hypothetical protein [Boudabousia tangfeifanii]AOZ72980.1 hypothetical protein BK816_06490 [Boudabousia tangfeifanii]